MEHMYELEFFDRQDFNKAEFLKRPWKMSLCQSDRTQAGMVPGVSVLHGAILHGCIIGGICPIPGRSDDPGSFGKYGLPSSRYRREPAHMIQSFLICPDTMRNKPQRPRDMAPAVAVKPGVFVGPVVVCGIDGVTGVVVGTAVLGTCSGSDTD
jgi:hypothetical protein